MSNITGYLGKNNTYYYMQASNASAANSASGASGASAASSASGAAGVTVDKLDVSEVINLFKRGDLTPAEMDKWISAHDKDITFSSKADDDNTITYTFTYKNVKYSVSCDKKAAASQLDDVQQNIYSKSQLKSLKLTDEEIAKYFIVASSKNDKGEQYAINPKFGPKTLSEMQKYIATQRILNAGETDSKDEENKLQNNDPELQAILKQLNQELDSIAEAINNISDQMAELDYKMSKLKAPIPPMKNDFILADGSLDEEAYAQAIKDYQQATTEYNYTVRQNELQMRQLAKMSRTLELKAEYIHSRANMIGESDKQLNELKDQIKQTNDPELKAKLQEQYNEFRSIVMSKIALSEENEKNTYQVLQTEVPVPPNKNDFRLPDGSIDGNAYTQAMQDYQNAKNEYESTMRQYEAQTKQIQNMDKALNIKAEQIKSKASMIGESDKQLNELIDLINQTNDPELKAKLQEQYEEFRSVVMQRIALSEEVERLEKQALDLPVPIPQSIHEFKLPDGSIDEDAYNKAIQDYEDAKVQYDIEQARINAEIRQLENMDKALASRAEDIKTNAKMIAAEADETKELTPEEQKEKALARLSEFDDELIALQIELNALSLTGELDSTNIKDLRNAILNKFDNFIEKLPSGVALDIFHECNNTYHKILDVLTPFDGFANSGVYSTEQNDGYKILEFLYLGSALIGESSEFGNLPDFDKNLTIGEIMSILKDAGLETSSYRNPQNELYLWVASHDDKFKEATKDINPVIADSINHLRDVIKSTIVNNRFDCGNWVAGNTVASNALGRYVPKIEDILIKMANCSAAGDSKGVQAYMNELTKTREEMQDNMGFKPVGNNARAFAPQSGQASQANGAEEEYQEYDGEIEVTEPDFSALDEAIAQLQQAIFG